MAERSPLLDSMAAVTPVRPAGPYAQIHDASMARLGPYLLAFYGYQLDGAAEDIRLAVSRGLDRFSYVFPETPLIARGEPGAWNSAYLMPVDLVVERDEFVLFYGASALPSQGDAPDDAAWRVCAGRTVARRDGFVRLSPSEAGRRATLLTVPMEVQHDGPVAMAVNAKLSGRGELRVGLAEADRPALALPGFELASCRPVKGDSVRHPLRWQGGERLPSRRFRVRVELVGAPADSFYGISFRTTSA